jgi:phosphoglycolate phosphatase-like HAD superfamily hydrolase
MRQRLFTDFDGPLMDVSERYYQVYLFCLNKIKYQGQTVVPLSKMEFWRLKRARVPEREIAYRSGLTAQHQDRDFAELRGQVIHSKPFFPFDHLHEWAIPALELAQRSGIELAIMTMRRQSELLPVLDKYGLRRFFPEHLCFCLRDDYPKTYDTQDKPRLMLQAIATLPFLDRHWIVGDTEADIIAGKRFNCRTIGVLSGIRDRAQLQLHHPDYILRDLTTAVQLIVTMGHR